MNNPSASGTAWPGGLQRGLLYGGTALLFAAFLLLTSSSETVEGTSSLLLTGLMALLHSALDLSSLSSFGPRS